MSVLSQRKRNSIVENAIFVFYDRKSKLKALNQKETLEQDDISSNLVFLKA